MAEAERVETPREKSASRKRRLNRMAQGLRHRLGRLGIRISKSQAEILPYILDTLKGDESVRHGYTHPSIRTIASNCGKALSTVQLALDCFETHGLVAIERGESKRGGVRRANRIRVPPSSPLYGAMSPSSTPAASAATSAAVAAAPRAQTAPAAPQDAKAELLGRASAALGEPAAAYPAILDLPPEHLKAAVEMMEYRKKYYALSEMDVADCCRMARDGRRIRPDGEFVAP